eukprot:9491997-Pyramimonas_sp.AAC.1
MSEAVCLFSVPTSFAFGADLEDVSREALIVTLLRGAAEGYCTVPFATVLWGCLKRFACFLSQRPSLLEQIWRISRARRSFSRP